MGAVRFVDPFFHQTVDRVLARPAAALLRRQTTVEVLEATAEDDPGIVPNGFIFHASRCGSTLVAQMLAASEANRVLSEPGPVDEILRTGFRTPIVPEDRRLAWMRAMISVLGRSQGAERRFFVKFDPWHVLALPLIRKAFPEVPWVFLVRDPLEILVSQLRSPGSQFAVGPLPPELFGLDLVAAATAPPGAYAARVLDTLLGAAARDFDDAGLVVDYRQLPDGLDAILALFGVDADVEERAVMASAATFDAKNPEVAFQPDSASKQASADDGLRAVADRIRPAFEEILRIREQRQPATVP
ncbi:MAG TPA: sulfotransferase [Acidimicrobiales bacterium]|nr:sulfotransferase [Acidimicrobiales bacterium]